MTAEQIDGFISDLLYAAQNAEKVRSYYDFNGVVIIGTAKRMGMEAISFDRKMIEKSASKGRACWEGCRVERGKSSWRFLHGEHGTPFRALHPIRCKARKGKRNES